MSEEVSKAAILAQLSALQAMTETELNGLNARMGKVERTQRELLDVATQGKTGLRVFLWLGGFLAGATAIAVAIWDRVTG